MHWNSDINAADLIALAGVLFTVVSTQLAMHGANKKRLLDIELKVSLMFDWWKEKMK